jgi:LEA14-like dessication related protein
MHLSIHNSKGKAKTFSRAFSPIFGDTFATSIHMNKKALPLPLLYIAVLSIVVSCSKPKEPQYLDFENVHVQKAGLSESIVGADLKYYNPNSFKIQLKEADLDLYVNDKFVGHSRLDTLIHIPALDTFYVPVSMKLNLGDLLKNAVQLFLNPEVNLKITGNAKLGKGGIYKNFPVHYEGKQRIDVLLKDSSLSNLLK